MARVKKTVVIDEELLKRSTEFAVKNDSSRGLSAALEETMRAFSPIEIILSAASELGFDITRCPSLNEVSSNRPKVNASAGETVRRLRDEAE